MEDKDIINLWKAQDDKIEKSLSINKQLLNEVITEKAKNALQKLIRFKATGIVIAVFYLILLGSLLFFAFANYSSAANYFIVSIGAIFLINIKALYDYIKHLVWTNNIDFDGSITETQQKLISLQVSIFKHTRIMFLQFPFWTTFYLSSSWFPHEVSSGYIIFQVMLTSAFTYLGYWLYKIQAIPNTNKKWFQNFALGSGGRSVAKALEFYKTIEELK